MPITLSCTACAKPFRARDESAGKKVKCPYCQAAVLVPNPNDPDNAPPAEDAPISPSASRPGASRADFPPPVSRPGASRADLPRPPMSRPGASRAEVGLPPPAPKVASPGDWGAAPPEPPPPAPPPAPLPAPYPVAGGANRPRPTPAKSPLTADEKTTNEALARAWNKARRGLGWVRFGLLFVVLLGAVEFGKAVYVVAKGPLPTGDGAAWVSIDGFINSEGANSIPITKEQLVDLACYGPLLLLAFLCTLFGRLVAGGAPRASGARGLFGLSALFTLAWFLLLVAAVMFREAFPPVSLYAAKGFVIAFPLAEFLFVVGVTACGLALERPGAAKAVGLFGFLLALAAVAGTIGWQVYAEHARPKPPTAQVAMYEWAVFAGAWLLVVLAYRHAAGVVRRAAREFVETVEDKAAAGA
jgi:hypothetical protein